MSNSSLVNHTRISPNSTNPRNKPISKITIHHVAGNLSVENIGNVFASASRKASSNYGIGTDGRVGMYVEECNRSWCSANSANDNMAVTIEVSNDSGDPDWHVSDKALAKLIDLCVDICQRNGIKKLNYTGDTSGNLTMHKWFTATGCPGPYLESKFPYIADEVNKRLGNDHKETEPPKSKETIYRIRKSWKDVKSQIGAYKSLENAKNACPEGYTVYDEDGKSVYSKEATVPSSYVTEFAKAVIAGEWGNGAERKENIYKAIQDEVNRLLNE